MGINFDDINTANYFIAGNTVNDALLGLHTSKITANGINRVRLNNINNSISTPSVYGLSAHNVEGTIIELNTIIDMNTTGFSTLGIRLSGNSHDIFLSENTVQAQNSAIGISLKQSMMNDLCCNNSTGANTDLEIYGTNSSTELKNSILNTGKFKLFQTSIGPQQHAGNRWQDGSLGELINTDMDQAVLNNLFLVNDSESNPTDGRIRPETIQPNSIMEEWFLNNTFGNSNLCSDPINQDCGLENIPIPNFLPDLDDYYSPGPCAPLSLDIDNDGVCDDIDPDPLDACIPNAADTDNDGVCDGIDRDPTDGNYPYNQDTDGDGISDVVDPDILNPCIPNGIDMDNDGVCKSFDPDDFDPLIPAIPSIANPIVKDINNNNFATSSIKSGKPRRTLRQIEYLADKVFGSHE